MKSRRSRWALAATVAIALSALPVSLPTLTPLVLSNLSFKAAPGHEAPPTGASWQVAMTSHRW